VGEAFDYFFSVLPLFDPDADADPPKSCLFLFFSNSSKPVRQNFVIYDLETFPLNYLLFLVSSLLVKTYVGFFEILMFIRLA
jgi:hypothetical protein